MSASASTTLKRAAALGTALALACASPAALADPPGPPRHGGPGWHDRGAPPPAGRWYDGAYGHNRYYPTPSTPVRVLPRDNR